MYRIIANGEDFTPRHPLATGQIYSARPSGPGPQHLLNDDDIFIAQDAGEPGNMEDMAWLADQWNEGMEHQDSADDMQGPAAAPAHVHGQPTQASASQTGMNWTEPAQSKGAQARTRTQSTTTRASRAPTPVHPHDEFAPSGPVYPNYGMAAMPTRPHSASEGLVVMNGAPVPGRLVRSGDGQIHIRPICGMFTGSGVLPLHEHRRAPSTVRGQAPQSTRSGTRRSPATPRSGSRPHYR